MEKHSILSLIKENQTLGKKMVALLIDPDKTKGDNLERLIESCKRFSPDIILIGGSLVSVDVSVIYTRLKSQLTIPLVAFPGALNQITSHADGVLFLSLISGRNSELLIGNHVIAAPMLRKSGVEVISTGYLLIDGGVVTSVQYMSNTLPIPPSKTDIASATALAGEFLGMKMIYLEAGSGALNAVSKEMVKCVRESISIPLIVGGGINSPAKMEDAFLAGADMVVIGTAIEKNSTLLEQFILVLDKYRTPDRAICL